MITDSRLVATLIGRLKEQQQQYALAAVRAPSESQYHTGLIAGKWQGLEQALVIIDEILNEDLEQEKRS